MLSLNNVKSVGGAVDYFFKYYANDTSFSAWYGSGAASLNLKGEVKEGDFKRILEGKMGNGVELGRIENGEKVHAPGVDHTFSAPKSVSILAEVLGDEKVKEAHNKAVEQTLKYIEDNYMYTRVMRDGKLKFEKVDNMVAAAFRHSTSRELDPQLHTHVILANAVIGNDGDWRSSCFTNIFENKMFLGMMYRSHLAYELSQQGYCVERTRDDGIFELKEVPRELIDIFSKRRKQIEKALDSYDYVNAKTAAKVTLLTRKTKKEIDINALREIWQGIVKEFGFDLDKERKKIEREKMEDKQALKQQRYENASFMEKLSMIYSNVKEKVFGHIGHIKDEVSDKLSHEQLAKMAVDYAVGHLSEKESVWKSEKLLNTAMVYSVGVVPASLLEKEIAHRIKNEKVLASKEENCNKMTTKEALERELDTLNIMHNGKGTMPSVCDIATIEQLTKDTTLNVGQKEAIKLILNNKDLVAGIQGHPGTGKTYMMKQARIIAEAHGYELIGLAPSASAASTLEQDSGIKSQTVSKFLAAYNRGSYSKEQMQNKIIVIDEVSLCSTSQMHDLSKVAAALNVRIRECGDIKQLDSPESGKPFAQQQHAGMAVAIMDDIIRQQNPQLRQSVYDALEGKIAPAIERLGNLAVQLGEGESFEGKAASTWLGMKPEKRAETMIIVPENRIRKDINQVVRAGLIEEGVIRGEEHKLKVLVREDFTEAQLRNAYDYKSGMKLIFNANQRHYGITNGDTLTVKAIKNRNLIALENSNGKQVLWHPNSLSKSRKCMVEVYNEEDISLQAGDRIVWSKNSQKHKDIINSQLAEVTAIKKDGIEFKLQNGSTKVLSYEDQALKHLNYGYAVTVHFSQGKTTPYAILVLPADHKYLTNQKIFNVIISRAKLYLMLITDDKKKLIETLYREDGIRESATEHQGLDYKKLFTTSTALQTEKAITSSSTQLSAAAKIVHSAKNVTQDNSKNTNIKKEYPTNYSAADIYKLLYPHLPKLLPEFGFVKRGNRYISTTKKGIDGSIGKSKGYVYVYENNPGLLNGPAKSKIKIWEYVSQHHLKIKDKQKIFDYLKKQAGLNESKNQNNSFTAFQSTTLLQSIKNSAQILQKQDMNAFKKALVNSKAAIMEVGQKNVIMQNKHVIESLATIFPAQLEKANKPLTMAASSSNKVVHNNVLKDNSKAKTSKQQNKKYIKREYDTKYSMKDIYNRLYHQLPSLLPEFGFVERGNHYISTTQQRIDGSTGNSKGKVYVYANNPGLLKDYTRSGVSIWDYVRQHHLSTNDKQEIFNYLKAQAGLSDSKNINTKINKVLPTPMPEAPKPKVDHVLLAAIHTHAQVSLFKSNNKVLEYLQKERGYSVEEIKKMELGLLANKQDLGRYLKSMGFSNDQIKQAYKMLNVIGQSHHLTIPFKDEEGKMLGLAGRNINHSNQSQYGKYMYTRGLSRSNTLFNIHNIKGGNEAVLVEGVLDCLHAHAKGIANVVGLGGTACNQNQLKQLEKAGIKQVTLCLDNDRAGREAASNIIEQLSKGNSPMTVKVTSLPQSIKDPDQMLQEKGVGAFKEALANSKSVATEIKNKNATIVENITNSNNSALNNNVIRDKVNIKEIINEM